MGSRTIGCVCNIPLNKGSLLISKMVIWFNLFGMGAFYIGFGIWNAKYPQTLGCKIQILKL